MDEDTMAEQATTPYSEFDELVPLTGLKDWAFKARTDLARYLKPLTIQDDVKPYAEAVHGRLITLETAIGVKNVAEADARAAFVGWLEKNDWGGGFRFFIDTNTEEVRKAQEAAAQAAVNRIIQSATSVAVDLRNGYSGVGNKIGTVVAGLSETAAGRTFTGNSGGYVRAAQQHALMAELLSRTAQREDWDVNACAEVDAMNKYLLATPAVRRLSDIPRGKLFFHAETYAWEKGTWQARKACKNCDQWLIRIGAGRV
ncbi:hypothetical protein GCM10009677_02150 [Sphaerisporangium rubeum]|uniref:Uncharacterized protein n=1 Tax=Sphaerisporangium rubeum TaxID=321317 RepID=A0A7X0M7T3_9ACTN|nr:hypothetical protein [Sphaerisporangium rubeum]MBB6473166.1 hypothetical protein [Sphaerisporangium rubeum]